jgi:hypothetical protein
MEHVAWSAGLHQRVVAERERRRPSVQPIMLVEMLRDLVLRREITQATRAVIITDLWARDGEW